MTYLALAYSASLSASDLYCFWPEVLEAEAEEDDSGLPLASVSRLRILICRRKGRQCGRAGLKITAGHRPFFVQFSIMATQFDLICIKLCKMANENFIVASQTQSLIFNTGKVRDGHMQYEAAVSVCNSYWCVGFPLFVSVPICNSVRILRHINSDCTVDTCGYFFAHEKGG